MRLYLKRNGRERYSDRRTEGQKHVFTFVFAGHGQQKQMFLFGVVPLKLLWWERFKRNFLAKTVVTKGTENALFSPPLLC